MVHNLTDEQWNWRIRIFALTWFGYGGFYLCRKNLGISLDSIAEELNYSIDDLAVLVTGYLVLYAIGQFCCGFLSDRFGPRIVVTSGMFISIGANFAFGLSSSFTLFMIFSCINGVGQSTGWSGLVKNMTPWFRKTERGIVMAWWGTNYVLGGFVATNFATFVAFTYFDTDNWRRAFFIPPFALAIIALSYAIFTRNTPRDARLPDIIEDDPEDETIQESRSSRTMETVLEVLSHPGVWLIAFMYFFLKLTRYSFLFWLPMYMIRSLGYDEADAGYTSSVYELFGFTGAVLAGYLSDKVFHSKRMPVGSIMLFVLAWMCWLHPTLAQFGHWGNAIGIGLIGIFTFGPDTLMTGAGAMDYGSKKGKSSGEGVAISAGFINGVGSIGGFCSPAMVAYITTRYGWDSLFYAFFILSMIGSGLLAIGAYVERNKKNN